MTETWKPIGNPDDLALKPWQKLGTKIQDGLVAKTPGNVRQSPPFTVPGALTVQTGAARWTAPEAGTIVEIRATVDTVPTGASIKIDVNKNGSTIFTTQANRPTIAISGHTITAIPDDTSMVSGDYFQIDIDQIGSTVAGSDLVVQINYQTPGQGSNTLTSTTDLTVMEADASPTVSGVKTISVTNGKLTDNGSGSVSLDLSGVAPTYAAPAFTFGTSGADGVASTGVRSDSQLALFDATAPTTQAFGDAAAAGSAGKAARRDHKHAWPTAAVTTSGLTQATAKMLGRSTAATGAIEEIAVGANLTLSAGTLSASAGGSVATDTIFDAKGDLAVGTGSDTAARLAVGTNDYVLTAASGEATGLKWQASSAVAGGRYTLAVTSQSGNYTVTSSDDLVLMSGSAMTATLPTAASITGRVYYIKNTGTGLVTIATTSSQTIDGVTTQTLSPQWALTVVSDGSNWQVV